MFCKQPLDESEKTVQLTQKGCDSILKAITLRQDSMSVSVGQIVHVKCRKYYTNPNVIEKEKRKSDHEKDCHQGSGSLRSSAPGFVYKEHCFFCGCGDSSGGRQDVRRLIPVRSMDMQKKILQACEKYEGSWVDVVRDRVLFVNDLHAADAVYHNLCSTNFRTGKQIPKIFHMSERKPLKRFKKSESAGRPKQLTAHEAFLKVAEYFQQNDDEQKTIGDLIEKMKEYCEDKGAVYGFTHMKNELQKHFGDQIIITEIAGKSNVVTLKSTATQILHDFHLKSEEEDCDKHQEIIKAAAKLIKHDIKEINQPSDVYPAISGISSIDDNLNFIPNSLYTFLTLLFVGAQPRKIASIGQAIIQATRPRALMAPLQIGLGVQMHDQFDSRFLIDSLHTHGFCCSYAEVQKFQRCAVAVQGTSFPEYFPGHFHQYVGDNVDHDIATLDGKNTFHGMGIIAAVTPSLKAERQIPRKDIPLKDIITLGKINIHPYPSQREAIYNMSYAVLENIDMKEPYLQSDLLWKTSSIAQISRPLWNGYMQMITRGQHPGKASVVFMPMIDMNPNDLTCIYSTLVFVSSHAKKYNTTPVITFDQPLWWKAHTIVESEPPNSILRSTVVRLGAFHTQMSFLGCIGRLMSGSGLHELLEVVYAPNSVSHMLSGKAVSRSVRGHLLVDSALNILLTAKAYQTDITPLIDETKGVEESSEVSSSPENSEGQSCSKESKHEILLHKDLQTLGTLMKEVLAGKINAQNLESNDVLQRLASQLRSEVDVMKENRTSALWIQYMTMIDILRSFIKAERTGNWWLHLQTLQKMLPYLAASGHNLYTKSVYTYLQKMTSLPTEKPDVYQHFMNGLHVIRRSDRFWAGLSTDLVIEQVRFNFTKKNSS